MSHSGKEDCTFQQVINSNIESTTIIFKPEMYSANQASLSNNYTKQINKRLGSIDFPAFSINSPTVIQDMVIDDVNKMQDQDQKNNNSFFSPNK